MPKSDDSYRARIRAKTVENERGCWIWQGHKNGFGYAQMFYRGRRWMVHRLAYTLWKGPIPEGHQVCHSCDTPSCANPDHLWTGSNLSNQLDSIRKRRHANAAKTHCPYGHEYAVDGAIRADGRRECLRCAKERVHQPSPYVWNGVKTHCNYGHPLSGDNLYVTPGDGRRQCRICRNDRQTERRLRLMAERATHGD